MLRFLIVAIAIEIVYSIVSTPNQNVYTSYQDEVDVFRDSVNFNEVQFQRIQNAQNTTSRKKSETVRKFLTHYNSLKPVAVLIDDTKEAYSDAKSFMLRVFELTPNAAYIPFSLQTFNSSGVSSSVEIKGNNTFENLLNYKQEQGQLYLDPTKSNGTVAFFSILNAADALPEDSAILIFIDRKIADEDLASHTNLLRKKNIKVYAIWGGAFPSKRGEDRLLRELCKYSGGLFLVNSDNDKSNYYYRQFISETNPNLNTSIVLLKTNLVGASELTFPIDSKVTGIHVRITPFVSSGSITTPKGNQMDVSRKEEIAAYSPGSFIVAEKGLRIVHLNLTTAPSNGIGIWRLRLDNTLARYNVTVFAYAKLTAHAYYIEKTTRHHNSTGSDRNVMKLGISTYITSISNISFVDEAGQPITDTAKYEFTKDSLIEDSTSDQDREVDVEFYNPQDKLTYAVIQGKDDEGNEFSRLTYISPYNANDIFPQPTLTIEVGAGSEIITTGGKFPVIIFEVTNQKSTAVDVRFTCSDEKSLLRFLKPHRQIIGPLETATVRLTLVTKFGSYEDEITFTAWIGSEYFTKKVIVDVGNQALYDNENPELSYSFSSDCSKVVFSKCNEGTWTVKITAKDPGSGLLQVTSYPKGLYFPGGFTTGTRQEVAGYYSDSCCSPDFQITAVDRLNNRQVVNINAYQAFWGPAQIAALVLGVLIFLLLILLIVYIVRRCIHKRENYNLPTYRGGRI